MVYYIYSKAIIVLERNKKKLKRNKKKFDNLLKNMVLYMYRKKLLDNSKKIKLKKKDG